MKTHTVLSSPSGDLRSAKSIIVAWIAMLKGKMDEVFVNFERTNIYFLQPELPGHRDRWPHRSSQEHWLQQDPASQNKKCDSVDHFFRLTMDPSFQNICSWQLISSIAPGPRCWRRSGAHQILSSQQPHDHQPRNWLLHPPLNDVSMISQCTLSLSRFCP